MTKLDPEAKRQNEEAKRKQKLEEKLADDTSPEQLRKDGGDIHPTSAVTPSTPQPENDPAYTETRYNPDENK
jgi:hypothetical protein